MAHAFIYEGSEAETSAAARELAHSLEQEQHTSCELHIYSFGLFSVEDARRISDIAYQSSPTGLKLISLHAARLFHEAQNALLKVIEEPPAGVHILIGVPTFGILLPTIRSRTTPFSAATGANTLAAAREGSSEAVHTFIQASDAEREKYVARLIDRSKSDNEYIKQHARAEALELVSGLMNAAHAQWLNQQISAYTKAQDEDLRQFLDDLSVFAPLMHERSVPLKMILEHIMITMPAQLTARA
jgi:hypothetical protein